MLNKFKHLLLVLILLLTVGACTSSIPRKIPAGKDPVMDAWYSACSAMYEYDHTVCDWTIEQDEARERNIAAIGLSPLGRPLVMYGGRAMQSIVSRYGHEPAVFIFSHEIGHALDYYMGIMLLMSPQQFELSADEWGGCGLANMGLSRDELTSTIRMMRALLDESDTHPGAPERVEAMLGGWDRCK